MTFKQASKASNAISHLYCRGCSQNMSDCGNEVVNPLGKIGFFDGSHAQKTKPLIKFDDDNICPVCESECTCGSRKQVNDHDILNSECSTSDLNISDSSEFSNGSDFDTELSSYEILNGNVSAKHAFFNDCELEGRSYYHVDDDSSCELSTDDEESQMLAIEESKIREYGIDSDEEDNPSSMSNDEGFDIQNAKPPAPAGPGNISKEQDIISYLSNNSRKKYLKNYQKCKKHNISDFLNKNWGKSKIAGLCPEKVRTYLASKGIDISELVSEQIASHPAVISLVNQDSEVKKSGSGIISSTDTLLSSANASAFLDDLVELNKFSPSEDETEIWGQESDSASTTSDSHFRWDRIPIGTFRRSRKVSGPLLRLSKAVKSTLGVIPHAIHETLSSPYKLRQRKKLHESEQLHFAFQIFDSDNEDLLSDCESLCSCSECAASFTMASALNRVNKNSSNGIKWYEEAMASDEIHSENDYSGKKIPNSAVSKRECKENNGTYSGSGISKSTKRKRRVSMSINDLSELIHDPSNPPSACASPSNIFTTSPRLLGSQTSFNKNVFNELDKFELEPAAIREFP